MFVFGAFCIGVGFGVSKTNVAATADHVSYECKQHTVMEKQHSNIIFVNKNIIRRPAESYEIVRGSADRMLI